MGGALTIQHNRSFQLFLKKPEFLSRYHYNPYGNLANYFGKICVIAVDLFAASAIMTIVMRGQTLKQQNPNLETKIMTTTKQLIDKTSLSQYKAAGGKTNSSENQHILDKLVDREVYYCASYLISALAASPEAFSLDHDDLLSVCCQYNDDDPTEALEHWIVSDWLAEKLAEHGEMTGKILGLTIWGRTCSGQAVSMDWVIQSIAAKMQILDGQRNSWANQN